MSDIFRSSQTTENLDVALAKAQGEIKSALMDETNPHFRSRFASLTAVWNACRASLAKHEISVTQWPIESSDGRIHLLTRVAHKGEWMSSTFAVPAMKQDPQGYGSGLTYLRRYALSAALGIVSDEDDDGNAATWKPTQQQQVNNQMWPKEALDAKNRREAAEREAADVLRRGGGGALSTPKPTTASSPPGLETLTDEELDSLESSHGSISVTKLANKINEKHGSPFDYRITFGKFNGKTIRESGIHEVVKYVDYLKKKDPDKPISENLLKLQNMVDACMKAGSGERDVVEAHDEIPF